MDWPPRATRNDIQSKGRKSKRRMFCNVHRCHPSIRPDDCRFGCRIIYKSLFSQLWPPQSERTMYIPLIYYLKHRFVTNVVSELLHSGFPRSFLPLRIDIQPHIFDYIFEKWIIHDISSKVRRVLDDNTRSIKSKLSAISTRAKL